MHSYEVEIKVLLSEEKNKDDFLSQQENISEKLSISPLRVNGITTLNDEYFRHCTMSFLELSQIDSQKLKILCESAGSFSVRTRGTDTQTILVVKATVNDESSSNGTTRIEWEVDLFPMTLDELDMRVIRSGFEYQAKWSRERKTYELPQGTTLCMDKNAGYGYLAEFERVITDKNALVETRNEILQMIENIGYRELDQEKLSKMFDFYNKNWREYYGTERIFTLE